MFLRCICDDYFNASVQLMSAACVVLLLQALRKINDTGNLVYRERITRSSRVTACESLLTHWPGCNTILDKSAHSHWHAYTCAISLRSSPKQCIHQFKKANTGWMQYVTSTTWHVGMGRGWAWEGDGHGKGMGMGTGRQHRAQQAKYQAWKTQMQPMHHVTRRKLHVRQCQSQRYIHQATDMGPDRQKLVTWPGCI